jgi:hypothetical protein
MKMEKYTTGTGQKIRVHTEEKCKGEYCVIHNPSDHHMLDWPTNWRSDRFLMERICPCGIGHPDPDDLNFKQRIVSRDSDGIHGCCFHFCGESRMVYGFTKYFVTRDGRLWNNKLGKFMKLQDKKGYLHVQLNENGKREYKSIHRLVAEAYIPNPDNKRTVNHKDSDKHNNNVDNLEWSTDGENIKHSYENGVRENQKKICAQNGMTMRKFSESDIKEIYSKRKNKIKIQDIANSYSVHRETISRILRGITYKEYFSKKDFEL